AATARRAHSLLTRIRRHTRDAGAQISAGICVELPALAIGHPRAHARRAFISATRAAASIRAALPTRARHDRTPLEAAVVVQVAPAPAAIAHPNRRARLAFIVALRAALAIGADFARGAGNRGQPVEARIGIRLPAQAHGSGALASALAHRAFV